MTSSAPATQETSEIGRNRLLAGLNDRITAADPAFSRLRTATRALSALLINGSLLAAVTFLLHPLTPAAYGITAILSFMGSTAVRDKTPGAQAVTRCFAGLAVIASLALSSLLAPQPIVADMAFLVIIFFAVYVRRFGPRWFAVGMMGFMAYFIGDYLRPAPADLIWVVPVVVVDLLVTQVVTNVLLRDDPERDFRRAVVTIDRRLNLILRDLQTPGRDPFRQMQHHLARLRDMVLMAEGFLPQGEAGSLAAAGPASDVAIALFDLQLAAERLAGIAAHGALPQALGDAALRRDSRSIERLAAAHPDHQDAARRLLLLDRARSRLESELGPQPSPAFAATAPVAGRGGTQPAPPARSGGVPASLQVPIQVTLACAIAIGAGLLVSPTRWYWAIITAFLVFNNTRSRADTAVRALQRSGGTFAGVIAGTAIAVTMHGQVVASGIAIPLLFFFAFYFLSTSYSLMIFFITAALALIYGLMGMFTPELLLMRLAETIVGGLAGALVAFFVFPSPASAAVDRALDAYLKALRDLVEAAQTRLHPQAPRRSLVGLSRELDRSYSDLASAARPLGGPWNAVTRFGAVREKLLLLTGCTHWGRSLAQSLEDDAALDENLLPRIDALAAEIAAAIERIGAHKAKFFEAPLLSRRNGPSIRRSTAEMSEIADPLLALEAIAALLERAVGETGKAVDHVEEMERVKGIEPSS